MTHPLVLLLAALFLAARPSAAGGTPFVCGGTTHLYNGDGTTVCGTEYVSYAPLSYSTDSAQLIKQPWWGNETWAMALANQSAAFGLVHLESFTGEQYGPYFAWNEMQKRNQSASKPSMSQDEFSELIEHLDQHQGRGTSMITLLIPPTKQLNDMVSTLNQEVALSASIKSATNRKSVQGALTSVVKKLREYRQIPANGLAIFCGTIFEDNGKSDREIIAIEPIKPLTKTFYRCDSRFHTEDLAAMLDKEDVYGMIIVDGNGTLYAKVQGDSKNVIKKFSVELPSNHNKGGQSSVRFARLREEKITNYVRKVCEAATEIFITDDLVNVKGIIIAGSGDIKTLVTGSQVLDARIKEKVMLVVDISCSEEQGLYEAYEKSKSSIMKGLVDEEKKELTAFLEHIERADGKVCYGIKDTIRALKMRVVQTVIAHDKLDLIRVKLENGTKLWAKSQELVGARKMKDPVSKKEFGIEKTKKFAKWLEEKAEKFKAQVVFVSDKSSQANELIRGFEGIGGLLKKGTNLDLYEQEEEESSNEEPQIFEDEKSDSDEDASLKIQKLLSIEKTNSISSKETLPVITQPMVVPTPLAEVKPKPERKKLSVKASSFTPIVAEAISTIPEVKREEAPLFRLDPCVSWTDWKPMHRIEEE